MIQKKKKSETVTAHRKHQKQLLYTKNISNSYWSQKTSVTVIVPRKPQRQLFVHRKLQWQLLYTENSERREWPNYLLDVVSIPPKWYVNDVFVWIKQRVSGRSLTLRCPEGHYRPFRKKEAYTDKCTERNGNLYPHMPTKPSKRNKQKKRTRVPHTLGWNGAQPAERRIGTPLTQVRFHGAARDISPRVNFQCRLSYSVRKSPCAIAYVNTCAHIKDPVFQVRVRRIMETLKHSACTVGWVSLATLLQLAFPGESNPTFSWEMSQWHNTAN